QVPLYVDELFHVGVVVVQHEHQGAPPAASLDDAARGGAVNLGPGDGAAGRAVDPFDEGAPGPQAGQVDAHAAAPGHDLHHEGHVVQNALAGILRAGDDVAVGDDDAGADEGVVLLHLQVEDGAGVVLLFDGPDAHPLVAAVLEVMLPVVPQGADGLTEEIFKQQGGLAGPGGEAAAAPADAGGFGNGEEIAAFQQQLVGLHRQLPV